MRRKRQLMLNIIQRYGFFFIILLVFVLAEISFWIYKERGGVPVHAFLGSVAAGAIFFASGLGLKTKDMVAASKLWQLHSLIQFLNFIMLPVVVRFAMFFIPYFITVDNWIITGFFAVSCLPPPTSSTVLLTKAAQGNESVAVINSVLGVVLGIVLTPLLLLFHVGISCTMPILETLADLASTVVVPFIAGMIAQTFLCSMRCARLKNMLPHIGLIFVFFTSFNEMFGQIDLVVSAYDVLLTLILVILMQIVMIYLNLCVTLEIDSDKCLTAADFVAVIFCSNHKSLSLGLPLLKTLYGGYSHLSPICLPLLIYHPVQLLIGALLSPFAHKWISNNFDVNL